MVWRGPGGGVGEGRGDMRLKGGSGAAQPGLREKLVERIENSVPNWRGQDGEQQE